MLKPVDIQDKEFELKMRGYDRDQVDDFLDEVIDTIDVLYKTNKKLQQKCDEYESAAKNANAVNDSVELIRYQCEEMKRQARIEADRIINDAKSKVNDTGKDIEVEYLKKKEQIINAREILADFKKNIRDNCNDIMTIIDKME